MATASGIRQEDGSLPGEPLPLLEGLLWFFISPIVITGLVWILVSASHNRYASPEAKRQEASDSAKRNVLTSIE